MPIYDRRAPSEYEILDRWDGGIGWLAHPNETGRRTSHAVVGEAGGVWVIDPIDAPGIDEELSTLGDVSGVIRWTGAIPRRSRRGYAPSRGREAMFDSTLSFGIPAFK